MGKGYGILFIAAVAACGGVTIGEGASSSSGGGASTSSGTGGGGASSASSSASSASSSAGGQGGGGSGGGQEVTQCPVAGATAAGTNTAVRVESAEPIDMTTVGASSLEVLLGGAALPGSVEAEAHGLTFLPQDPLPTGQLVQVVLSPAVLDDKGHSLAATMGSWSFTTGSGPALGSGFTFTDPVMPPSGDYAPSFALALDGESPILAWRATGGLVAAEHDGTSFPAPLDFFDGGLADQIALAVGAGRVHIGWTDFGGFPVVNYSAADLPFTPPVADPLGMSPASYGSRVAADGTGKVAMLWQVDPEYWTGWGFRYTTSSDSGATWAQPIMLDPMSDCADAVYVDGYLVFVWASGNMGSQQLLAAASSDNGATFGTPVMLASSTSQLWCPLVADNGAGAAVIAFQDGPGIGMRSANVTSFTAATSTAGPVIQLAAPDEAHVCVRVAASPATGRVVVARTRGHSFQNDFVTELYTSDDGGSTFGMPTTVDMFHPDEGCPELGYAPSGDLHMAWLRNSYTLEWSHGQRKRPCE